jgi:hypothetical protein
VIARERRRLRVAFGSALLAVAAPATIEACTGSGAATDAGGGTRDSSAIGATADASREASGTDDAGDGSMPDAASADDGDAVAADVFDSAACTSTITAIDGTAPDGEVSCELFLPCGLVAGVAIRGCGVILASPDGAATPDGSLPCVVLEDGGCNADASPPNPLGPLAIVCNCDIFFGGGRRPSGSRRNAGPRACDDLGAYLARLAHEEARSIEAFEELRAQLRRLGAPAELTTAAARAARDEVRHARMMTALAKAGGAVPPRLPRLASPRGARGLEAIARENAAEGCIRETFAALLAHWQARHAERADLRRTFARIAIDETRHAALAWAIARWAETRLDARARARVGRARTAALRELHRALWVPCSERVMRAAGLPPPQVANVLLASMVQGITAG